MALTLMYITNNPVTAQIAQEAGVDRIWIDMEYIGKDERQKGMDTVKNHHTVNDIKELRPIVTNSELMVRVNPIHRATKDYCSSEEEINQVIEAGDNVVMLPMFRTATEVADFVGLDVTKSILDYIYQNSNDVYQNAFKSTQYLTELIDKKWFGKKTNKGFYYKDKDRNLTYVYDIK